jgi:hypothetical protein
VIYPHGQIIVVTPDGNGSSAATYHYLVTEHTQHKLEFIDFLHSFSYNAYAPILPLYRGKLFQTALKPGTAFIFCELLRFFLLTAKPNYRFACSRNFHFTASNKYAVLQLNDWTAKLGRELKSGIAAFLT